MNLKKYLSLQTNRDRKMIKKTLNFKKKFRDTGTPKKYHTKTINLSRVEWINRYYLA